MYFYLQVHRGLNLKNWTKSPTFLIPTNRQLIFCPLFLSGVFFLNLLLKIGVGGI